MQQEYAMSASEKIVAIRDGLKNMLVGRGTSVDKSAHDFWHFMPMGPEQVEAGYRASWLLRKIVDLPGDDMTREGRVWSLESEEVAEIEAAERRLKVWPEILDGLVYGRLGGGVVIVGTNGDMSTEARDGEELLYLKALPKSLISLATRS